MPISLLCVRYLVHFWDYLGRERLSVPVGGKRTLSIEELGFVPAAGGGGAPLPLSAVAVCSFLTSS